MTSDVMGQMIIDNLKSERETSPYQFYGIEIDEATDSANKSIIIAFIRTVGSDGALKNAVSWCARIANDRRQRDFCCDSIYPQRA